MIVPQPRPVRRRRESEPSRWGVYLDGVRIGELHEVRMPGARSVFYEALVPHPVTGKPISLELHPDREQRLRAIIAFHEDPMTGKRHWS
ncbi:hypothetical protein MUN74_15805 [Agromyces endophyticus]|uniref:hypothetical protein n=1 Tax=Agromyces sp. H17E-10 TaxID=2932244 RepID=UPI001FD24FA4|nr:hypothetical protein [Agromyces sp. H17E-10]UOQ88714.1 hypothetical protein MUN74_15805 [Agromyces sp. H17E-10]